MRIMAMAGAMRRTENQRSLRPEFCFFIYFPGALEK
jgi:hypothetical protein